MANGLPAWVPQEQIPPWVLQRMESARDPMMGQVAQAPQQPQQSGLVTQGPPEPSDVTTARRMPTMSLEPFKPGSQVPTVADLYPNPAMATSYLRSRGIDPYRWHPSRVPLQGPELKMWADREKARLDEWKTQREVETLRQRQETDITQARAREATELNRARGTLKQGYRWDPKDPTKQVMIEQGPAWREQSSKHAADLSTLRSAEEQALNAVDTINTILDPENKDGFNSNFGTFWTGHLTQYIPTEETTKIKKAIESLQSMMQGAGLNIARGGGSIGQITVAEWEKLGNMVARLSPGMGEKDAADTLRMIARRIQSSVGNIQETYKKEWGDSPFVAEARPMTPPGVPGVRDKAAAGSKAYSDAEKERRYQEWKARQRQ